MSTYNDILDTVRSQGLRLTPLGLPLLLNG